jgi:hypothetical protein
VFNEIATAANGRRLAATKRSYTGRDTEPGDDVTPSLVDINRPMTSSERQDFKATLPFIKFGVYFVPVIGQGVSVLWDGAEVVGSLMDGKTEKAAMQGTVVGASSTVERSLSATTGRAGVMAHIYNSVSSFLIDSAWDKYREPPKKE